LSKRFTCRPIKLSFCDQHEQLLGFTVYGATVLVKGVSFVLPTIAISGDPHVDTCQLETH
jgi:hypothetical protein